MEQDYYIPPNNEQISEEPSKQKTEQNIKKLDPHLAIIAVQGAICAAVLVLCLIIKLFFGDFFLEMKNWYQKNMNVDTDINQVLNSSGDQNGTGGPLDTGAINIDLSNGFAMPVSGVVSSQYGYRTDPFTGNTAIHNGIDIAAESGSKIMASLSGKVVTAQSGNADYGNYIILDHGGFQTLYGHCQSLKVSEGEFVSKGQTIALCGSTGRSTGPHLHFEIRVNNKNIDPTLFLKF